MKNQDSILIFGSSGQIGKSLIRIFTKNNYKVIAVTRSIHQKGYQIKTQSNYGYLELEEIRTFTEENITRLMNKSSICINLIGILYEKKEKQFDLIHTYLPTLLSKLAFENSLSQFIHLSALGIESAIDSKYAKSKLSGEIKVRQNFPNSVVLKPSIVYSVDDNFTTNFMSLLSMLPVMPLYYNGKTKFTPIHVSDLSNIIFEIVHKKIVGKTIECVGPEVFTFKEIILKILKSIKKKRYLFSLPLPLAKINAKLFQLMPKPLLTLDQLRLLKYDNIISNKYKTNFDLNMNANRKFEEEINRYSYNWTSGGQFSKKRTGKDN
ncbi:complex I NDUFA9 subunit family protein [Candidatus Pelagibacter sp.]|nr:complex I NDUFA9 subunit family protein [Candidatus Pelagibacter sp.]|tara:strand:- start:1886 stop:2851 length:966 start_codon:yes stop_codon:yes gene_type:complete